MFSLAAVWVLPCSDDEVTQGGRVVSTGGYESRGAVVVEHGLLSGRVLSAL